MATRYVKATLGAASAIVSLTVNDPAGRAAPGGVGFLGDPNGFPPSKVLNPGSSVPGCEWDGATLVVNGSGLSFTGYRINGSIDCYGNGLTLTGCLVIGRAGSLWGVHCRSGTLRVSGSTVKRADPGTNSDVPPSVLLGATVIATNCDLSGYSDGVDCGAGSQIDRCCIHGLAHVGDMHVDGIALDPGNNISIRRCWIDAAGRNGNSSITMGNRGASNLNNTVTVEDCYLNGGGYALRIEDGVTNATVRTVDCDGYDFGPASVDDPSSIAVWDDVRDANGALVSMA